MFGGGLIAAAMCSGVVSGGGGGDDDWYPPDDWIPVPEPAPYEMYLLLEVVDLQYSNSCQIGINAALNSKNQACGHILIEWSDGSSDEFEGAEFDRTSVSSYSTRTFSHTYSEIGQYLIKVTLTELTKWLYSYYNYLSGMSANAIPNLLIFKSGSGLSITTTNYINFGKKIQYCKIMGAKSTYNSDNELFGLPASTFSDCVSLVKVDFWNSFKSITTSLFSGCYNLKYINAPKTTLIQDSAFSGCYSLKKVEFPICETVGNSAFLNNYLLDKAVFGKDCTFGTNCFSNCYNLYPRPDGTIRP